MSKPAGVSQRTAGAGVICALEGLRGEPQNMGAADTGHAVALGGLPSDARRAAARGHSQHGRAMAMGRHASAVGAVDGALAYYCRPFRRWMDY